MRRRAMAAGLALLVLTAGCSGDDDEPEGKLLSLGEIEVVAEAGEGAIPDGAKLRDAAVNADGTLYLALDDSLVSLRPGREPHTWTGGAFSIKNFRPLAVASMSSLRELYFAHAGGEVMVTHENSNGAVVARFGTESDPPGAAPATDLGPPRYMTIDQRRRHLYMADLCRVVRVDLRAHEISEVAGNDDGPACREETATQDQWEQIRKDVPALPDGEVAAGRAVGLITGLTVDERTGDVYLGVLDSVRRVTPDGRIATLRGREKDTEEVTERFGLGLGGALVVSSIGDVLVGGVGSARVVRVAPDGAMSEVLGEELGPDSSRSGPPTEKYSLLGDDWIGLDGAGNLYSAPRNLDPGVEAKAVHVRRVIEVTH